METLYNSVDIENESTLYEEFSNAKKNILSTNRQLNADNIALSSSSATKNFPNFQVNNVSLKKRRHQFIKRVSSSGADTNSSDNSDTENLKCMNNNMAESLTIEDFEWSRNASAPLSTNARNKFKRQNKLGVSDKARSRPLSVSSERAPNINADFLDPSKSSSNIQNNVNSVLRTKSLAEQSSEAMVNGKQSLSMFASNSHEHLNVLSGGIGKGLHF